MPADRFCNVCGVSLDLHPNGRSEETIDCTIAEAKAVLLDRFGRRDASYSPPGWGSPTGDRT